jgi:hypothetical protein
MATLDATPGTTASPTATYPPGDSQQHYTGVVVIHGIGNQKRNSTLLEALNARAYWYDHHAGLDLQPEGPGRV